MNEKNAPEDAPFNMAMMFYYRINDLMKEKDKAYIVRNIPLWFRALKALYKNISFKIKDQEQRGVLLEMFAKAEEQIKTQVNNKNLGPQISAITMNEAEKILDSIDVEIMQILDEHKMIFPRIELNGGLEQYAKKMGLNNG